MNTEVLDTHGFTAFMEDLARMSGKDVIDVIIDQAGAVLDLCIQRSPDPWKAGRKKVRESVEFRIQKPLRYIGDSGPLISSPTQPVPRPVPTGTLQTLTGQRQGKKGFEWYIGENRSGKRLYLPPDRMLGNAKFHLRQGIKFGLYQEAVPRVQQAIEAIGSVKASWVALADMIGAPLRKAPAWVKKVRSYFNDGARSRVQIDSVQAFVELVNTNAMLIQKYNGAAILQGAIDTRMAAYTWELKKKVFENVELRAKRYPGIFTNPN